MTSLPAPSEDLRAALGEWYRARRRRLPWREEPTPYRVWVSEIMLQQTQVATVIPYFERFVAAFPTVDALAAAPEEDVLARWSGLGYYRRCRHLHAAAKQVVAEHGGALPAEITALRALPGIGPYTAGAIASIAFGAAEPALDGNVARVLARLTGLETPIDKGPGQKTLWGLAGELLDPADPSAHNQAMMELGALVCHPRRPDCPACPVSAACVARAEGRAEALPVKAGRVRQTPVHAVCGLARRRGEVLLARRPEDVLLGGLWEVPGGPLPTPRSARREAVAAHYRERLSLDVSVGGHLATVEHVFSHRRLTLDVYAIDGEVAAAPTPRWYVDARWVPARPGDDLPLSKLTRKVLAAAGGRP